LGNPDLESAIHTNNDALMVYLTRPDIISALIRWCLTSDFKSEANSDRLSRSAVQILSHAKALISRLQDDETFRTTLRDCQNRGFENSVKYSENFQTIFLEYIRCTNGSFVQHFGGLLSFLVDHIDLSPLRFLLVQLLTVYRDAFSEDELEDVGTEMSRAVSGSSGYFVAAAIREAVTDTEGSSLVPRFQSDTVLKGFLEAALNPSHVPNPNLFQAEIFTTLEIISRNCAIAGPIFQMYEPRFEFRSDHLHCGMVAALRVFKGGLRVLLPRFFDDSSQTILNSIILRRLEELPHVTLCEYIREFGMVQHIYRLFATNQVHGHLTDLAAFLDSHSTVSPLLQTREWRAFAETQLHPRLSDRAVETIEDQADMIGAQGPRKLLPLLGAGMNPQTGTMSYLLSQVRHDEGSGHRRLSDSGRSDSESSNAPLPPLAATSLSMTSVFAAAQTGGAAKPGFIGTGASFSLPTLYQADKLVRPLLC
jgi:hypothetical protein